MSDRYRLVFSGEVLEGQHRAVVKKRLSALLKLEGERLDRLFSDTAVTLKKNTDKDDAARFVSAFRKCGAVLQVLPVDAQTQPEAAESDEAAQEAQSGVQSGMTVAPRGADLLSEDERRHVATPDIVTDHLALTDAPQNSDDEPPPADVPDTQHIEVAEVGADLNPDAQPAVPSVNLDDIDFEVEEPGSDISRAAAEKPPEPPDTSHIKLA